MLSFLVAKERELRGDVLSFLVAKESEEGREGTSND